MARGSRPQVLVVCSPGGHRFDAVAISGAWADRSRAWVSLDKPDVRSLLARERLYVAHGPTSRNIPNLLRNLALAWRVIAETRPRALVTTGAGVGVPFAWVGRICGARVIYVECAGRVDRPSMSARLIAPTACRVYAQWPELAEAWRGARYAGNVLLAPRADDPAPAGSGVLVTVGTSEAPFDRLLRAVDRLELAGERVVVQHGVSAVRPARAQCVDFLPFNELDRLTQSARVVICHAGVGSIAQALAHGRRPIVIPRLHRFGEAVDDHQVLFAHRLQEAELATVVEDLAQLEEVLAGARATPVPQSGPDLSAEIAKVLDELLVE